MAEYIYSTNTSTGSSFGNVRMLVDIYRIAGDEDRTEKSVTFKFGVRFRRPSDEYSTFNSVAAWYNGVQRFAQTQTSNAELIMKKGTDYHAYFTSRKKNEQHTTPALVYTYTNNNIAATTTSVSVTVGLGWKDWAGTKKGEYTFNIEIPEYWTNGKEPRVEVTDKKTNTVIISGSLGKSGVNNEIKSAVLYYTTDGSDPAVSSNTARTKVSLTTKSGNNYSKSVTITKDIKKVRAYTVCTFDRNTTYATDATDTTYYAKPSDPGQPVIYYTRTRFTPKERIIYKWPAAKAGNDNSPVVGYRVRLFQKKPGKPWTNIPIWSTGSGTQLSKLNGTSTTDYIYDRETDDALQISLGHAIHGFEVGDSVKLSIQAYSRFGLNNTGDNSSLLSSEKTSAETPIQNAGIVNIKVGNAWKEGQVWVKVNNKWQEAESVNVKANNSWQESE